MPGAPGTETPPGASGFPFPSLLLLIPLSLFTPSPRIPSLPVWGCSESRHSSSLSRILYPDTAYHTLLLKAGGL